MSKKLSKSPNFNPYWIYGTIILILLSLSFFGEGTIQASNKTNTSDFEKFLLNGDIDKVLIQNEKIANTWGDNHITRRFIVKNSDYLNKMLCDACLSITENTLGTVDVM